jgi:hypothetical protein
MTERERRLILRFLKTLPPGGARLAGAAAPKAQLELSWPDGCLRVEASVLAAAARAGLVARDGNAIRPLPEAAAFIARHEADGGLDFAAQHRSLAKDAVAVEGESERVTRNLAESPLGLLERLKGQRGEAYFPRDAIAAGERLHADFTRGQLQPQITMRFEPRLSQTVKGARGGAADISDSAMAARLRVGRAVAAMGPELAGVALDVCCFMKGLETVERERLWPARSAKLMLKTALLTLHRHYQPPARAETRHWGEEGFRPELG